jgi:predicted transglutaminase-like cysteine proteinase
MKLLLTIIVALLPAGAIAAGSANGWFADGGRAEKVVLGSPMLAPTAQIRFCLKHPDDCPNANDEIQPPDWELTAERFIDLAAVNREVNAAIEPATGVAKATQDWKIAPRSGNCHDYAVTKRHDLLSRGWPSRSLLLAEVIVPSGEHHLLLVVRTRTVDLVLDNLTPFLRPVGATINDYEWLRIESPDNPLLWSTVIMPSSMHVTAAKHYR